MKGQITERFTRAVDQLGSDNIDVRIGGVYALRRIADNSPHDRNTVQFILGAFIRNHATWSVGMPDGPEHPTTTVDQHLPWSHVRAPDIQAAAEVLGNRRTSPDARRLYLSRVDLRSVQLDGAHLTDTQFRHANLARAWLRGIRLDNSDLKSTDLRQANLEDASLVEANLNHAYLEAANLRGADLTKANLRGADLRDANLADAILSGALADTTTAWPPGFDDDHLRHAGVRLIGNRDQPSNTPNGWKLDKSDSTEKRNSSSDRCTEEPASPSCATASSSDNTTTERAPEPFAAQSQTIMATGGSSGHVGLGGPT